MTCDRQTQTCNDSIYCMIRAHTVNKMTKLEGKYSLESTDPQESEIRAPPQPLPYLMPIPLTRFL